MIHKQISLFIFCFKWCTLGLNIQQKQFETIKNILTAHYELKLKIRKRKLSLKI